MWSKQDMFKTKKTTLIRVVFLFLLIQLKYFKEAVLVIFSVLVNKHFRTVLISIKLRSASIHLNYRPTL
jgi:hypothetical protein